MSRSSMGGAFTPHPLRSSRVAVLLEPGVDRLPVEADVPADLLEGRLRVLPGRVHQFLAAGLDRVVDGVTPAGRVAGGRGGDERRRHVGPWEVVRRVVRVLPDEE